MPRGTVNLTAQHHDLTTLPEGFVKLVPLPYGAVLHRRENAMKMSTDADRGENSKVDFEMIQHATRWYEFQHCITEHNIEDHLGRTLDFANVRDFDSLDPAVGAEIEELIDKLNGQSVVDEGNSGSPATQSSQKVTGASAASSVT